MQWWTRFFKRRISQLSKSYLVLVRVVEIPPFKNDSTALTRSISYVIDPATDLAVIGIRPRPRGNLVDSMQIGVNMAIP